MQRPSMLNSVVTAVDPTVPRPRAGSGHRVKEHGHLGGSSDPDADGGEILRADERDYLQPDVLSRGVLRRLAVGNTYEQIAAAVHVSPRTVRRLVSAMKQRTGASSVAALCVEADRLGWLR